MSGGKSNKVSRAAAVTSNKETEQGSERWGNFQTGTRVTKRQADRKREKPTPIH